MVCSTIPCLFQFLNSFFHVNLDSLLNDGIVFVWHYTPLHTPIGLSIVNIHSIHTFRLMCRSLSWQFPQCKCMTHVHCWLIFHYASVWRMCIVDSFSIMQVYDACAFPYNFVVFVITKLVLNYIDMCVLSRSAFLPCLPHSCRACRTVAAPPAQLPCLLCTASLLPCPAVAPPLAGSETPLAGGYENGYPGPVYCSLYSVVTTLTWLYSVVAALGWLLWRDCTL